MATVRITETIRNHVRKKIKEMFQDRFNAAYAELQSLPLADAAYDDTFPPKVLGLVDQLMKGTYGAIVGHKLPSKTNQPNISSCRCCGYGD